MTTTRKPHKLHTLLSAAVYYRKEYYREFLVWIGNFGNKKTQIGKLDAGTVLFSKLSVCGYSENIFLEELQWNKMDDLHQAIENILLENN